MLRIRDSKFGLEVEGTRDDLEGLRARILEVALAGRGEMIVAAESDYDPKPYTAVLEGAVIRAGAGPTMVAIDGTRLSFSASSENLRRLASFIAVPEGAKEGWHSHYEYFSGNEFIMPNSEPLVFSLRRLTTA